MKMFVRLETDNGPIWINPGTVTTVQERYDKKIRVCFHETDYVDVNGTVDSVLAKLERGMN